MTSYAAKSRVAEHIEVGSGTEEGFYPTMPTTQPWEPAHCRGSAEPFRKRFTHTESVMRQTLLILLVFLISGCSGCASLSEKRTHSSALRLDFDGRGKCSGTAIGPHKILTATHCFAEGIGEMKVNGQVTGYIVTATDGLDHSLVTVTVRLTHWVTVGPSPKRGQEVFLQGNPGQFQDLLRRGYVSGTHNGYTVYDINAYFGDSGAGIMDSSGRLIAVVCALSIESQQGASFQLMASQPFAFTAKEWAS